MEEVFTLMLGKVAFTQNYIVSSLMEFRWQNYYVLLLSSSVQRKCWY